MTEKANRSLVDDYEATEAGAQGLAAASLAAQVGNLLDEALEASQLDQRTLATKIGVTEGRVSQVLNGDGNLRVAAFARYMRAMGYEVHVSATPVDETKPHLPKPRRRTSNRRAATDLGRIPTDMPEPAGFWSDLKGILDALHAAPRSGLRRRQTPSSWTVSDAPSLREWAELWRDLSHNERARDLSADEQNLLGSAKNRVASELSSSIQTEPAQLQLLLDELLAASADEPDRGARKTARAKRTRTRR